MKHCLRRLIAFGCLSLPLVALLVAWMYIHSRDYTLNEATFTSDALIVVETNSNLKLPKGSRGQNMIYMASSGNPSFVAELGIPPDAQDDIKKQIEMRPNEDYHPIGSLSEKVSWWIPEKLAVVVERKYTVGNSYVHALLCRDGPKVILFVEAISL